MTSPRPDEALLQAMQDAVERAGSATVLYTVQFLMRGGATSNQACRLASFMLIDSLGRSAVQSIGVPESTAGRWRAEIRKFRDAAGGVEAMDESVEVPNLARLLTGEDR